MFAVGAAAIVVVVWLLLSYSMGMAVCVVEKKTAWESLKRSMQLSKGTRGRIFVLFLLIMVLSIAVSIIGYIFAMLAGVVASLMGRGSTAAIAAAVVGGVLYAIVSIGAPNRTAAGFVDRARALLLRPAHPQRRLRHRVDDGAGRNDAVAIPCDAERSRSDLRARRASRHPVLIP